MSNNNGDLLEICCYCCLLMCACTQREYEREERRSREQQLINDVAQLRAELAARPNVIVTQPIVQPVVNKITYLQPDFADNSVNSSQPPSYNDAVMEQPSAPLLDCSINQYKSD